MAQPAARSGDHHACPAYSGDNPHQGGPVHAGSGDVFINGMPSARAGDPARCDGVGLPDTLTGGSRSVFINNKPSVRTGDATAHGGVVTEGSNNVWIG
ncbi:MAG: PAAR domain-containing protein [Lewinellaceae bacterium]|nr:PAAR domain-containing protein [Lewinellaceae bacterium]